MSRFRVVYFSGKGCALRTAGTRMLWKWSLASSQPSSVLGSSRRLLTSGSGGETGVWFHKMQLVPVQQNLNSEAPRKWQPLQLQPVNPQDHDAQKGGVDGRSVYTQHSS